MQSRHFVPIAQRAHDSDAWAALVAGAADMAANPLPEDDDLNPDDYYLCDCCERPLWTANEDHLCPDCARESALTREHEWIEIMARHV